MSPRTRPWTGSSSRWGTSIEITTRAGSRVGRSGRGRLRRGARRFAARCRRRPDAADWARNLEADPSCRVSVAGRSWDAVAEPLHGPSFAAAIAALILKYGTPAERLGAGPAFRLVRNETPSVVPVGRPRSNDVAPVPTFVRRAVAAPARGAPFARLAFPSGGRYTLRKPSSAGGPSIEPETMESPPGRPAGIAERGPGPIADHRVRPRSG